MTSKNLISAIVSAELRVKQDIADKCLNPEVPYSTKRINLILSIILVLLIPVSYVHLNSVSKNTSFYINIVKSDLTEALASAIGGAFKSDRYSKILGKLYLLPLRTYSHMVRGEWVFESRAIKNLLHSLIESYILFFVTKMKSKRFFIREDFFGEASLICSISQSTGCPYTISFQHGSLELGRIMREGIYPGQRANMQIVHDIVSRDVFRMNNPFRSMIVLSKPCYRDVSKMHLTSDEIYMIGNGSLPAFRELDQIAASIKEKFKHIKIYYKPHPSEAIVDSINMINCTLRDGSLLMEPIKRVFIGQTSTFLYDAYMSGHLVYCLNQSRFPCFDSLAMLGSIPEITPMNASQVILSIKKGVALNDQFKCHKDALDYESIAKIILDVAPA